MLRDTHHAGITVYRALLERLKPSQLTRLFCMRYALLQHQEYSVTDSLGSSEKGKAESYRQWSASHVCGILCSIGELWTTRMGR